MARPRLIRSSLAYYWRTHLAVGLGVVAATAVIAGALLVGASVRASLRQMTLDRLGGIDVALEGPRFFREELASDLAAEPGFPEEFQKAAPALVLRAGAVRAKRSPDDDIRRAGGVTLWGVDARLWDLTKHGGVQPPAGRELILSRRLAEQLQVQAGDRVTLNVELPRDVPRDSLLGKKEEFTTPAPVVVREILDETSGVGRLGLRPDQQSPLNAFVNLQTLQQVLELAAERPSRNNPDPRPARVNALFLQTTDPRGGTAESAGQAAALLAKRVQLDDVDLRLVAHRDWGYVSLESRRMILETPIADRALQILTDLKQPASPVLVYVANEIRNAKLPEGPVDVSKKDKSPAGYAMYATVAGLNFPTDAPFGPYEFVGPPPKLPLGPQDIVISDWLATDLRAAIGDAVRMKYHVVGSRGELPEPEREFVVAGVVKLDGTRAADPGLTPQVKGITDADSLDDWEQPFDMKFNKITPRDEEYWDLHKATPKAFIALDVAQDMWRSRYGDLTSIRVPLALQPQPGEPGPFVSALLPQSEADLQAFGLAFRPVKFEGLRAATGSNDFSVLFISFSFFLIAAAAILVGLLFRLGIERRASQVGLLLALGLTPRQVARQLWQEAGLVVAVGAVVGMGVALGYAWLMLYGLRTVWSGAVGTTFLQLAFDPLSLLAGAAIAVVVALISVWLGLRSLWPVTVRDLMAGATSVARSTDQVRRGASFARFIAWGGAIVAVASAGGALVGLIPSSEAFGGLPWRTVAFFLGGFALLVAGLSGFSVWIDSDQAAAVRGNRWLGVIRLAVRNASRHGMRSGLTVGLIAFATFVIVAVAAGQRNPAREQPDKNSGNGGFTLVAQTAVPILYDLNTPEGREKLLLDDPKIAAQLQPIQRVVPFRVKPGEDASCLNLYQTRLPTILGVPQEMIDRGGFRFIGGGSEPWKTLNAERPPHVYPVFGDANTLTYSLHKGVGQTIGVPPDANPPADELEIAGMLDGSVFQGVLLISEQRFQQLFPDQAGYQYFLIDVPLADADHVGEVLETALDSYGFDAEPVGRRLRDFLAVQNTYLATFRTLGALGLLLGTFGLATVMLRNVLERRGELALLRAVGFRSSQLGLLVLAENALLLVWGMALGTASALTAMAPYLFDVGADVRWDAGAATLAGILLIGLLAATLAVWSALATPVLQTLRAEN